MHVYMRQKRPTVAILRCLGAQTWQIVAVYVIQTAAMGLTGALGGAILGVGVQYVLPGIVADFLPVAIEATVSWPALGQGVAIGLSFSLLFALLPLLPMRYT
ncbi:FtsX-like permease family protein, partial [Arthrospira platensis SPKY1]|nr:FtsX-like permease family protein [Arthrospira platensis SPKY1]